MSSVTDSQIADQMLSSQEPTHKVGLKFTRDRNVAGRRIYKGGFYISYLPQHCDDEAGVKRLVEETLELGYVSGVKLVNKTSDRGAQIQSAYVDILYWFNTYQALLTQTQLLDAMRSNGVVSVSDEYMCNGCARADWTTEFSAYEILGQSGELKDFEFAGVPIGKHDFRFKNGKPMTHISLRPTKIGITCDGSPLDLNGKWTVDAHGTGIVTNPSDHEDSCWTDLFLPVLPKNMVDFANYHADGDVDKRNAILDDILSALFENYQCVGRVDRIDYSDITTRVYTDEDKSEVRPTGGVRALVQFAEWWNTVNAMVIRNSAEAFAKQWQIRNHCDQYGNQYGFIVVRKNEKQRVETETQVVSEP